MSPMNRANYPADWEKFSREIRFGRANGRCECEGECGLHRTTPGPRRCVEVDGAEARWAKGKVILTVAHLNAAGGPCQCEPRCVYPEHVKAMCQRCHLRYDGPRHQLNASQTRDRKRNQLFFPFRDQAGRRSSGSDK